MLEAANEGHKTEKNTSDMISNDKLPTLPNNCTSSDTGRDDSITISLY
jgi:hypothetical protein